MYAPIQLIHHERAPGEQRRAVRSESIGRREEARTSQLAAEHGKEGRSSAGRRIKYTWYLGWYREYVLYESEVELRHINTNI